MQILTQCSERLMPLCIKTHSYSYTIKLNLKIRRYIQRKRYRITPIQTVISCLQLPRTLKSCSQLLWTLNSCSQLPRTLTSCSQLPRTLNSCSQLPRTLTSCSQLTRTLKTLCPQFHPGSSLPDDSLQKKDFNQYNTLPDVSFPRYPQP